METLFTQALGLVPSWAVSSYEFSRAAGRIDFRVRCHALRLACPACGAADQPIHDVKARSWRHLNFFQYQASVHAEVPRVACSKCGKTTQVAVPWTRKGSGFTELMEAFIVALCREMPMAAVAKLLGVSDNREAGCWISTWPRRWVDATRRMREVVSVSAINVHRGGGARIESVVAMRIFHVITGLDVGGAETVLCRLLESLRLPGFEHTVVSLLPEGALGERVSGLATLHHLGMRAGRVSLSDVLRLRRLIRAARPDVVQGWMYHANLLATIAAADTGVPVVWGVHHTLQELRRNGRSTRAAIWVGRWMSRAPKRIVYCAQASRRDHERFGYCAERSTVIQNGCDINSWVPDAEARRRVRAELKIPEGALAIGLVARVHPMKDHANFLQAAGLFLKRYPDTVFVLVGHGAEVGKFVESRLVEALGLGEHVRLCGRRDDVAAIDNALDIATSSSWGEAFPMILVEAMATGTPCVATDVGDVREIVGDTGMVVAPRDPVALCAGWSELSALGLEGRRALGRSARRRVTARYSQEANARAYAQLFHALMAKHPTGTPQTADLESKR